MAICNISKDLLRSNSCEYNLVEIKDIYIANFTDVTAAPVSYSESSVTVSAITLSGSSKFYHVEPTKDSVSYSDELVVEDNGNKYRTHTLTFGLNGKYDSGMVSSVDALALGRFFVVVKTTAGEYLALGRQVGMEASEQTINGGSDGNGVTVTLTANVTESAVPLSETAIATVVGA